MHTIAAVLDQEFYDRMQEHLKEKGVACESAKEFDKVTEIKSATFTLSPSAKPFVVGKS